MQAIMQVQTSFRQATQQCLKTHKVGMTFEMLQIMSCLWKEAGINQQELAARTFKDKACMTYLINNLEKKGWVRRVEDQNDRRNKLILVTEEGKLMRQRVMPLLMKIYADAGESLNERHTELCMEYLQELNNAFKVS